HGPWQWAARPRRTILNGVRTLPPATVAQAGRDGTRRERVYWRLAVREDPALAAMPAREREDLVEAALMQAVERRMVADVPVGVLLSGGVDRSEEHMSELQSRENIVCRLLLEKK